MAVLDAAGNPVQGAPVTFQVTPGASGAAAAFAGSPAMPVLTDQNGLAAAPALTANSIAGSFTVTASAGALNAIFNLSSTGNSYVLAANSAIAGSNAGNGSVLLTASVSLDRVQQRALAPDRASQCRRVEHALVQFSYSTNANPAAQTGTLSIAGQIFTVTQAGASYTPFANVTTIASGLRRPQGVALDGTGNCISPMPEQTPSAASYPAAN